MDWKKLNDVAFSAARGCYQQALLSGSEPWSGAGLQGRANTYSSGYARSRTGLIRRLNDVCRPLGARFATCLVMDAKVSRLKRRLVVRVDGVDYDFVRECPLGLDAKARLLLAA